MTHAKGAASGLTPMQKAYAEARARGETQAEAARIAGVGKGASVWATRTDRKPNIRAYVATLKRAAQALVIASDPAKPASEVPASAENVSTSAALTVATITESLQFAADAMRRTDGKRVVREYVEESQQFGKVRMQVTDDGIGARDSLIRHYDAMDAPKASVNVLAILSNLSPAVLAQVAGAYKAMLSAGQAD